MNRRELFRRIAGAAAAAGIPVRAETIQAPVTELQRPALIVLRIPSLLDDDGRRSAMHELRRSLDGTAFAGVPALILDEGLTISFLDASGRVLNAPLEDSADV